MSLGSHKNCPDGWQGREKEPPVGRRLTNLRRSPGYDCGCWTGSTMWNWPDTFWKVFLPRLEDLGYITIEEKAAFLKVWSDRCADPAAYMHLPPMYEMIAVRQMAK